MIYEIFYNNFRTGYANIIQLRNLVAKEYLHGDVTEESTANAAAVIVSNSLVQVLGLEHYVSKPGAGGYRDDHGRRLSRQSLLQIMQLIQSRGVPHRKLLGQLSRTVALTLFKDDLTTYHLSHLHSHQAHCLVSRSTVRLCQGVAGIRCKSSQALSLINM